jgi:hypothetical protein
MFIGGVSPALKVLCHGEWRRELSRAGFGVGASLALVLAILFLFSASPQPAQATHLCGNTGSTGGPFNLQTFEAGDWRNTYSHTFALASYNRLARSPS